MEELDIDKLKEEFNRGFGSVRVLSLHSPT